jgi:hypothetical protein
LSNANTRESFIKAVTNGGIEIVNHLIESGVNVQRGIVKTIAIESRNLEMVS